MSGPGRPSVFSEEAAAVILERLADGESLRSICADPALPARTTVYSWVIDDVAGFSRRYARAREMQAYSLEDDVKDVADDGRNDWMKRNDPENPGWEANGEHLQRSRLRVDARKWMASKILPKVYGEKTTTEVTGANGGPVQFEDVRAPIASLIAPPGVKGGKDEA